MGDVTLTSGRGPLGHNPGGRFSAPLPDGVVYVEPFRRRVRGIAGGETVVDSERVLLVHRAGEPPFYAFPTGDVHGVVCEAEPETPGYVRVAWDAVDSWYEEDEQVFLHARNPYHRIDCVRTSRHLRVEVAGEVLVDTAGVIVLYETALEPRLYVARDVVRMDLLVPSPTTTYCPYKGTASHWSAVVGGTRVDDVAWSYEDPLPESSAIGGMLSFYDTKATVVHDVPPPAEL